MSPNDPAEPIGACPDCGSPLFPGNVLVEYETSEGATGRYVDCTACDDVVRPRG